MPNSPQTVPLFLTAKERDTILSMVPLQGGLSRRLKLCIQEKDHLKTHLPPSDLQDLIAAIAFEARHSKSLRRQKRLIALLKKFQNDSGFAPHSNQLHFPPL